MRALVTGGAGFIGSHICQAFLERGWHVVALANFDSAYDPTIKEQNMAQCLGHKRFRLIRGDIGKQHDLEEALAEKVDVVLHLAAMVGVRLSIQQAALYQDVNVVGTTRLLAQICQHNITKLIFASTSSVYGNSSIFPTVETAGVDQCLSPYGVSKRAGELLCWDVVRTDPGGGSFLHARRS